MTMPITIKTKARFHRGRHGSKVLKLGAASAPVTLPGRIPRVARLLALAHRFEKLIADGEVRDYADLARLGHVTRARVTQIMNLLGLVPEIQEEILMLPAVQEGKDRITERQLRQIHASLDWRKQRRLWASKDV